MGGDGILCRIKSVENRPTEKRIFVSTLRARIIFSLSFQSYFAILRPFFVGEEGGRHFQGHLLSITKKDIVRKRLDDISYVLMS